MGAARPDYIGVMGYKGIIGFILGLYRDNGKENGNYNNGLYIDQHIEVPLLYVLSQVQPASQGLFSVQLLGLDLAVAIAFCDV